MGLSRVFAIRTSINAGRDGTVYTDDGLQRVTNIAYPDGGNKQIDYGGSASPEIITTRVAAAPDPDRVSSVTLDSLGRNYQAEGSNGSTTQTIYDSRGRVNSVSNPYYSTSDSTYGVTAYTYDALDRIVKKNDSDGVNQQTWGYTGNAVTVTQENGVQWQRKSDALGRLTQVLEQYNFSTKLETDYSYDPLRKSHDG